MLQILLSLVGGAILLIFGIVVAISIFIYRFHPTTPGSAIGFSANIIQAPAIFIPMLFIFTLGFAATFLLLRRR